MTDQQPTPTYCGGCERECPVWFAPNDLWSNVVGSPRGFLCPTCFIDLAEESGVVPTAWRVEPEAFPDQQPTPPPLDLGAIEHRVSHYYQDDQSAIPAAPVRAMDDSLALIAECRRLRADLALMTQERDSISEVFDAYTGDCDALSADLAAARAALEELGESIAYWHRQGKTVPPIEPHSWFTERIRTALGEAHS